MSSSNSNLVGTWLRGIGITNIQILHNFDSAGCTSAQHLASLQLSDYDALLSYLDDDTGTLVEPSEEQKKKLYYLVQRVRMAVQNGAHGNTKHNATNDKKTNEIEQKKEKKREQNREDEVSKNVKSRVSVTNERRRSLRLASQTTNDPNSLSDITATPIATAIHNSDTVSDNKDIQSRYTTRSKARISSKRLSTIPSESVAAMSPLPVKSSFSYTCDEINEDDENNDDCSFSSKSSLSTRGSRSSSRRKTIASTSINEETSSSSTSAMKGTNSYSRRASFSSSRRSSVGTSSNGFESDSSDNNSLSKRTSSSSSRRKTFSSSNKSGIVAPSSRARGRSSIGTCNDGQSRTGRQSMSNFDRRKSKSSSPPPQPRPISRRASTRDSSRTFRRSLSAPIPAPLTESRNQSLNSSGEFSTATPVYIHGEKKDNSWESIVSALREENADSGKENLDSTFTEDESDMRIRVVIRKRPVSSKEASKGDVDVIQPVKASQKIFVYQPKVRVDLTREIDTQVFAFDNVFAEDVSNRSIYFETIQNIIPKVFEGSFSSVFAYGQTGSGKTFTMMGSNLTGINAGTVAAGGDHNMGLYYLAACDVFRHKEYEEFSDIEVSVSFFEIYGGKLFDLLNNRQLVKCLEDHKGKVCFPGLSEHPVHSADDVIDIIENGAINRSTGSTSANADSSRSHAVLQLSLCRTRNVGRRQNRIEHGRLTFIDLAGSERGADTNQASKTTRMEGAEINTSLLALKEVIRALAVGSSTQHIPFRGSKLTQVLKESFVGKSAQAVMIACVAPNLSNCEHTLNTLRYADRVKERNPETRKPKVGLNNKNKRSERPVSRASTAPSMKNDRILPRSPVRQKNLASASGRRVSSVGINQGKSPERFVSEALTQSPVQISSKKDPPQILSSVSSLHQNNFSMASDDYSFIIDEVFDDPDKDSQQKSPKTLNVESEKERLKEEGKKLLSLHREVMTNMLSMMKHEMSLVHSTDDNRENVVEYVDELDSMQKEKLAMINSLRQTLASYQTIQNRIKNSNTHLFKESPDSHDISYFDDLRESMGSS